MNAYVKWVGFSLGVLCLIALKLRTENYLPKQIQLEDTDSAQVAFQAALVKRFSFGFDGMLASLAWIDLLQNANHRPLAEGKTSWEYRQLRLITELDPHFTTAYYFGALELSVLRRDREGAKAMLERWVAYEPNQWRPLYLLGYHLFFEMNNYRDASAYILKAASYPNTPLALASLGVRLLGEAGALQEALAQSLALWPFVLEKEGRQRILMRIRTVLFHLQKEQWMKALADYRAHNRREPTELSEVASYRRVPERALTSEPEVADDFPRSVLQEKFGFHYDSKLKSIVSNQAPNALGLDILGIYRPNE